MTDNSPSVDIIELAAQIVAAYVANNNLPPSGLADLIASVHASMMALGNPVAVTEAEPQRKAPAVYVRKSLNPDYLICLEDGKKFTSLKRHLQASYGMSPDEYRKKWGLPSDYPMVAPAYAAKRSELAKASGLGASRRKNAAPETIKRGRKAKA